MLPASYCRPSFSAQSLHECDVTKEKKSSLKAFQLPANNETWSAVLPSSRPSTNMTEARAAVKLIVLARKICVQQIMYRRAEKRLRKGFRPAAHSFLTRFRKSTQYEGQSHASKTLSKRKLHVLHAALEDSATGDTKNHACAYLSLNVALR